MAAAFFKALADPRKAEALSAGTEPGPRVHPEVLLAMGEIGLDLSGAQPRLLTPELAAGARYLVTMGCGEKCPVIPGVPILDWPLPDPKGQPVARVREIRDEVKRRVQELLDANRWGR
jgi:arsenate reductase